MLPTSVNNGSCRKGSLRNLTSRLVGGRIRTRHLASEDVPPYRGELLQRAGINDLFFHRQLSFGLLQFLV